ncbi:exonuclease 1 [Olea europaea subsp. europaea]|uniref:Exonuclease 1 n=1 Tax=Olea europaea subsp. europaea TaxID=158383 RepID=A0A8S0UB56_OLEEU|nr:exonuclease 1 [Olea europaea subsp. europaea]
MGITGLLPLLKSIMTPIHIKDLEGCSVAVDTYSWLHKGALSCSTELCKGLPTSKHIDYCMHRVNLLRHYGIRPVLVFDGGPLEMKLDQENKRARSRRENLSRAMEHESNGNLSAAYGCYQKAIDISPSVAHDLIQVLKQQNVSFIVAPYEADAQMTFLAVSKQVDAVITEDSDLIAFGCPRIIYKMDKFGQGVEFRQSMLQHNKELNLTGFTQKMFLEMCIISGCDYLQSLPGIGLKKSHALVKKFKSYDKIIKHLIYNSVTVTPLYEESFKKAILTFLHQRVYDPVTEDIVHLSEPSDDINDNLDFLAKGIAQGDLDPFTKEAFQRECGNAEKVLNGTYQVKNFNPEGERKKLDLPAQKNLLTNYYCIHIYAKSEFRAPRIAPKRPNASNETSSPNLDVRMDSVKHGANTDSPELVESPDHGLHDREVANDNEMQQNNLPQSSVYKPCVVLHKDRAPDREGGKMVSKTKDVVVRSCYFLHKSTKEIYKENKIDMDQNDSNRFENHVYKSVSEAPDGKCRAENKKVILRSSYFQNNTTDSDNFKRENELVKNDAVPMHVFDFDAGECKTKIDNKRGRVRSSYFQPNSVYEHNQGTTSEDLVIGGYVTTETCECTIPRSSSSDDYAEGKIKKRKVAYMDSQIEEVNGANLTSGTCAYNLDEETKGEGKFGCNISHLGHYSDIAEKSMEKFVSVISSFRFTSSGSRASGLRAPLKDIKNTCKKRSTHDMDLSQFAYEPTKKKAPSRRSKS